eukprot:1785239-Pleurochrysis_carterae.AAC.6
MRSDTPSLARVPMQSNSLAGADSLPRLGVHAYRVAARVRVPREPDERDRELADVHQPVRLGEVLVVLLVVALLRMIELVVQLGQNRLCASAKAGEVRISDRGHATQAQGEKDAA